LRRGILARREIQDGARSVQREGMWKRGYTVGGKKGLCSTASSWVKKGYGDKNPEFRVGKEKVAEKSGDVRPTVQ